MNIIDGINAQWMEYEGIKFRYLYCVNAGSANTIVAVGGAFQRLEITYKNEIGLIKNNSVLFIELPGFGVSDNPPVDSDFTYYSDCIIYIINRLNIYRCWGYAYSYGTGPMFKCASRNSNTFEGLVLSGTSAYFTNNMKERMINLIKVAKTNKGIFPKEFIDLMCSKEIDKINNYKLCRLLLTRMLRSLTYFEIDRFAVNYSMLLREHRATDYFDGPLLTFNGEYDSFVHQSRLIEFNDFCSDHYIDVVPNSDHFFHLQNFNYSSDIVNKFIDKMTSKKCVYEKTLLEEI